MDKNNIPFSLTVPNHPKTLDELTETEQDLYELNIYITNTLCAPIAVRNHYHSYVVLLKRLAYSYSRFNVDSLFTSATREAFSENP